MSTATASATKWNEVKSSDRCPICEGDSWCRISENRDAVCCRRSFQTSADSSYLFIRTKPDSNGDDIHVWSTSAPKPDSFEPTISHESWDGTPATAEIRDKVYRTFLSKLLYPSVFVRDRGISGPEADSRQYKRLGKDRLNGIREVIKAGYEQYLPSIPGFVVREKNGKRYWSITGKNGVIIPVRNKDGMINALKVRIEQATDAKYKYVSSRGITWVDSQGEKHEGPGPGSLLHFPLFDGDRSNVRITEGELKADIATMLSGVWTISIPGVNSWRRAITAVKDLHAKTVYVAFDSDFNTNAKVRDCLIKLVRGLEEIDGIDVIVETWPSDAGKGIDDVLIAGKSDSITQLSESVLEAFIGAINVPPPTDKLSSGQGDAKPQKPVITLGTEEDEINRAVITLMSNDPAIFQRDNTLIHVVRDCVAADDDHPIATPKLAPLPPAKLRSLLTRNVSFQTFNKDGDIVEAHPPDWMVRAIPAYGDYPKVPVLEGVVEAPTLRPNGSILDTPGYDRSTRLLFESRTSFPSVPENPTRQQVQDAIALLFDVVVDFPFTSETHKSGWLAALLTPMARAAFNGPAPLFLIEANVRGAGKSLLSDTISIINSGRTIERSTYVNKDEEMRKQITSIAIAGYRMVLIDNINGHFGNLGSLDAALTATRWCDRVLGASQMVGLPLNVIWYGTGNNIEVQGDTVRRVLPIRLEALLEHPEDREGFKHENLLSYVTQNRPALVAAALTILRGFFAAGRPQSKIPSWGSYEEWSGLIRQAIVWAGLPDPYSARIEIRSQADHEVNALAQLIDAIEEVDPHSAGITAADMIKSASDDEQMRLAISEICPTRNGMMPGPSSLGNRLKRFKKRVVDGKYLMTGQKNKYGIPWLVCSADLSGLADLSSGGGDAGAAGDAAIGLTLTCAGNQNTSLGGSLIEASPESLASPAPKRHHDFLFDQQIASPESPREAVGLIGPPSSRLLVRGHDLLPDYHPATDIPPAALEYNQGGDWWTIPDHWRRGVK